MCVLVHHKTVLAPSDCSNSFIKSMVNRSRGQTAIAAVFMSSVHSVCVCKRRTNADTSRLRWPFDAVSKQRERGKERGSKQTQKKETEKREKKLEKTANKCQM